MPLGQTMEAGGKGSRGSGEGLSLWIGGHVSSESEEVTSEGATDMHE